MKADRTSLWDWRLRTKQFLDSQQWQQDKMEYETMIIVAQTILASIIVTAGIMYFFVNEAEKEKKE